MDRKKTIRTYLHLILLGIFAVCCLVQGSYIWKDYGNLELYNVQTYGTISSLERTSILYVGDLATPPLRWLNAFLPPQVPILLYPDNGNWPTSQSLMQFFLLPHTILLCDQPMSAGCLADLKYPTIAVLAYDAFPPPGLMAGKVYIALPSSISTSWLTGIYLSPSLAKTLKLPLPEAYRSPARVSSLVPLMDLLVLAGLFFLGFIYTSLFLKDISWIDLGMLGLPIGMGLLTWVMFIGSYFGIAITWWTILIWFICLAVLGFALNLQIKKQVPHFPSAHPLSVLRKLILRDRLELFLSLAILACFSFNLFLSVGRGYTLFDDIVNWSLKGYAIAAFHTIWAGNTWGGHILAYPLNTQLMISIFRLFDGDFLPGSKAVYSLLTLSLFFGFYRFWSKAGVRKSFRWIGLLLLLCTPVVFFNSTVGLANWPFTVYLILGTLWFIEGVCEHQTRSLIIGGGLMAFAAWTRPEGLEFGAVLMASVLLVAWLQKQGRLTFTQWLGFLAPMIMIPVSWFLLLGEQEQARDQIGVTLKKFLLLILQGNFHWSYCLALLQFTVKYFTSWQNTGYGWLIFLVLGAACFLILGKKVWHYLPLLTCWMITVLFPLVMFYVASFPGVGNYESLWDQEFYRSMLPAIVLLTYLGILLLGTFFASPREPGV
jgi:hypothetical protein